MSSSATTHPGMSHKVLEYHDAVKPNPGTHTPIVGTKYPRYPGTVPGCPNGGDPTISIPGILGLSLDVPPNKYPRYPGTVPGCPYGGDSTIPRY